MKALQILFYSTPVGNAQIEVFFEEETFWLSQKKMAELFGVGVRTVNEHLRNIFSTSELDKNSVIRNFRIVQQEGSRENDFDKQFPDPHLPSPKQDDLEETMRKLKKD